MTGTWGKKSKNCKRCTIFFWVLVLFAARAGAEGQKKVIFGIDAGWSFGGDVEDSSPHFQRIIRFDYHLGGKIRFDLNELFAMQFNLSYQALTHKWDHNTSAVEPSDWVTERWGLFTLGLNGIFNSKKVKRTQFYFLAGSGICLGSLGEYSTSDFRFVLVGGCGVKFFLRPDLRSAINLEMTFHGLLNSPIDSYWEPSFNYIQLGIGYEFYSRKK